MPRNATPEFEARLNRSTSRLTTLFRVVRPGPFATYPSENAQGFTSLDRDIVFGGLNYEAKSGVVPTAVKTTSGVGVDNMDVVGILRSDGLAEGDLIKGLYDDAAVDVRLIFWDAPEIGGVSLLSGYFGEVRERAASSFEVEFRSLMQRAAQTVGFVCTGNCQNDLGDERCGVDLEPLTYTGAVASVIEDRRVFATSSATIDSSTDLFVNGFVLFTSGDATDLRMEVKIFTHDAPLSGQSRIELQQKLRGDVAPGDTFTLVAGCDKQRPVCRDIYNNMVNYRGMPDIPGVDKILRSVGG